MVFARRDFFKRESAAIHYLFMIVDMDSNQRNVNTMIILPHSFV